jgi:hypothetical protein
MNWDKLQETALLHPFWFLIMAAVIVWYSTITVYVAIRGAVDIKHMLERLEKIRLEDSSR